MRARSLLVRGLRLASDATRALAHVLHNGSAGFVAGARGRISPAPVSDHVLAERVRARMGHNVSHASIDVQVVRGEVTLRGPVLDSEIEGLLRAVRAVPGVRAAVNQLEPHPLPGHVPGLQG